MKITKAVIPAAGLGTRVLPATKSMPKEMFPIVDKPAIQYIVEEAVRSGITDILIITNRGKGLIEDHFDRVPELEDNLQKSGKTAVLEEITDITHLANIFLSVSAKQRAWGMRSAVHARLWQESRLPFYMETTLSSAINRRAGS